MSNPREKERPTDRRDRQTERAGAQPDGKGCCLPCRRLSSVFSYSRDGDLNSALEGVERSEGPALPLPSSALTTYFKKYLWPEDVLAISQPAGSGTSSGISKEDWRRCWAAGVAAGPETTPLAVSVPGDTAPSCREAGEEWARTC